MKTKQCQNTRPQRDTLWQRCAARLAAPMDGASLAAFRVCFGLVMLWHVAEQFWPQQGTNAIRYLYVDTAWNFSYPGFGWIRPWPEPFLSAHFLLIALAALCVAVGFCHRLASATLFLSYTYVFLLEQAKYNNHYYLICLLAFLLIWMPGGARFSLDAWLRARRIRRGGESNISPWPMSVPFWTVFLLRGQLFIVYFYAGLAKINDDWLTGVPLASPAGTLHDFLARCGLPQLVTADHVALLMAWGGLVFDLAIGFLLVARRTRWLAMILVAVFHVTNQLLFPIGVFPVLAFTATLIFLEPDWPVRLARRLRQPRTLLRGWKKLAGSPIALSDCEKSSPPRGTSRSSIAHGVPSRRAAAFVAAWLVVQVIVPLRHFAIPGDANWTEEGQHFSWRMMLRAKVAGHLVYHLRDDGLQARDAHGRPQFQWDRWRGRQATYVPIDCQQFNWSHYYGLNVTHEPVIGERIIFAPFGTRDEDLAEKRREIQQTWQRQFGRQPIIHETVSLQTVLEQLLSRARSSPAVDPETQRIVVENASAALELSRRQAGGGEIAREKRLVQIVDHLRSVTGAATGSEAKSLLRRLHPFELQGAAYRFHRFLVVEDQWPGETQRDQALKTLCGEGPYLVWLDVSRLRPADWRALPASFVTFEDRDLKIVWNYFHELNQIQLDKFPVRPDMIRQYAVRIAGTWEAETGRRPKVFASSNVMLNYHQPHPLVDPTVDLAGVGYAVLSHNEGVLPRAAEFQAASARPAGRR